MQLRNFKWIIIILLLIVGALMIWLSLPRGRFSPWGTKDLEAESKLLEIRINSLERTLKVTIGQSAVWEKTFKTDTKAFRDTVDYLRKSNKAYQRFVFKGVPVKYSKAQIDSITQAIVARYDQAHGIKNSDPTFDESIVINTAESGIRCDSLLDRYASALDKGSKALNEADSVLKKKNEVIDLMGQKEAKQDTLLSKSKQETKDAKKGGRIWEGVAILEFLALLAQAVTK